MLKIILILVAFVFAKPLYADDTKCNTALSKLKPSCNALGAGVKKLKKFSSENQTIGQSLGMKKAGEPGSKTLKDITKENKTVDQTYRNIKEKLKK